MNIRIFLVSCLFFLNIVFIYPTFAAGSIPRDGLRLELLLATGAQDTSGNNRIVSATGIAPSYQTDPVYGVPYAQFSGSGGLRVNTSWSAGASDDFTLSMWVRIKKSELSSVNGVTYPYSNHWLANRWGHQLTSNYMKTIFTTQSSVDTSSLSLSIRADYKCGIGGVKNIDKWYGLYYYDPINNPSLWLDCSKLNDEKWHFIVIKRNARNLSMSIDDTEVYKNLFDIPVGRTVSLGNSIMNADTGAMLYSSAGANPITSYNETFLRSTLAGFRMYSRPLTNDEIEALGDEYRYAQSDLMGAGNISLSMERYIKPILNIKLNSITPNLSKDVVDYQYSTDGKIFSGITDVTDISVSTGSLSYRVSLNLSSVPDGKVNITLRVKSGETYQNIGSLSFNKIDGTTTININQPSSDIGISKTISATTEWGNILYMFQTRNTICDSSITTWEDYSDLTFTSKNDNNVRICYKAVNLSTNKTVYKLSTPIQGVQSIDEQKAKGYTLFENYTLWTKSTYQKPDDSTSMVLDLLAVSAGQSQGTINGITMTDINGDGLVDFLYSRNDPVRRAILINNGNFTFKTVYKCVIDVLSPATLGSQNPWSGVWIPGTPAVYAYYGDCADPTR